VIIPDEIFLRTSAEEGEKLVALTATWIGKMTSREGSPTAAPVPIGEKKIQISTLTLYHCIHPNHY
jgi:hypothetical protein